MRVARVRLHAREREQCDHNVGRHDRAIAGRGDRRSARRFMVPGDSARARVLQRGLGRRKAQPEATAVHIYFRPQP